MRFKIYSVKIEDGGDNIEAILVPFGRSGISIDETIELLCDKIIDTDTLKDQITVVDTSKKEIIKILFPDFKSNDDKLIEQAQQLMQDGKHMRVHVDTRAVIRDEDPLKKFKKS